jgi:hypothetical protein
MFMGLLVDVVAQFNIVLVAIMLSGITVKMGHAHGTIRGDTHFRKFYILFLGVILENVGITLLGNFIFLPLFTTILLNNYPLMLSWTADMILFCNIWFAWTFGYRQRLEVLILTLIDSIMVTVLFVYPSVSV